MLDGWLRTDVIGISPCETPALDLSPRCQLLLSFTCCARTRQFSTLAEDYLGHACRHFANTTCLITISRAHLVDPTPLRCDQPTIAHMLPSQESQVSFFSASNALA